MDLNDPNRFLNRNLYLRERFFGVSSHGQGSKILPPVSALRCRRTATPPQWFTHLPTQNIRLSLLLFLLLRGVHSGDPEATATPFSSSSVKFYQSAPVNSRILPIRRRREFMEGDAMVVEERLPPHEIVARNSA
ncbi:hypothetical protein ACSQ67_010707 [Phaseolus vulgaris]